MKGPMSCDLKTAIRQALEGSTSQNHVDIGLLYKLGARKKVEAALLEMYRQQVVGCCLITRDSVQKSVWWLTGACLAQVEYGRPGPKARA
jgi:hypothetical protein